MIKSISIERLYELSPLFERGAQAVLFCILKSNAQSFLPHSLCSLFEVCDNKNKTLAVMCLYSGSLIICSLKKSCRREISQFIFSCGATTLECSLPLSKHLGKAQNASSRVGKIMVMRRQNDITSECKCEKCGDVRHFFNVLKSCNERYADFPFENYYCDFFYRSTLSPSLYAAQYNGSDAAVAAILHKGENYCVISDVSVLPSLRRKKIGTGLVFSVCRDILSENKTPALLCTEKGAAALYRALGFKTIGKFGLVSVSNIKGR